jgi:hypothetical protein
VFELVFDRVRTTDAQEVTDFDVPDPLPPANPGSETKPSLSWVDYLKASFVIPGCISKRAL